MRTKKNKTTETPAAKDSKVVNAEKVVKAIEKVKEPKVIKEKVKKYDVKLVTAVKLWGLKNSNRLQELQSLLKSYHSVPLNSITESDLEMQTMLYGDLDKVEQTIKKFL